MPLRGGFVNNEEGGGILLRDSGLNDRRGCSAPSLRPKELLPLLAVRLGLGLASFDWDLDREVRRGLSCPFIPNEAGCGLGAEPGVGVGGIRGRSGESSSLSLSLLSNSRTLRSSLFTSSEESRSTS